MECREPLFLPAQRQETRNRECTCTGEMVVGTELLPPIGAEGILSATVTSPPQESSAAAAPYCAPDARAGGRHDDGQRQSQMKKRE
jgi:hypothetical protein